MDIGCIHKKLINSICVNCKQRFLYDNNLPFSDKLDKNLDDLKKRIELNKASLLIIDGAVGEGKTTLGVHCAEYFQKKPIDFKKQLAMGGVDFQEKLQMCIDSKLIVIIYDEAGDFNSRGALTKFNQMLNRIFETYRTFKILVIIILPNFKVLDSGLFDKQIPRMLLHCEERSKRYGNYKGYSLLKMYYLRDRMKSLIVTPMAYALESPNFKGHFLDLFPSRSRELNKSSTESKSGVLTDNIINNRGLINLKGLASTLGRSPRWILVNIKKHNIKETLKFKRAKYYDKVCLGILENEKNK